MNALFRLLMVAGALAALAPCSLAQVFRYPYTAPPNITQSIADIAVPAGTTQSTVNLKKTFGLLGVNGQVVRFSTNLGNIDVELLADDAPGAVANFLSYVNRPDDDSRRNYSGSIIHRSVPGVILQGGGYQIDGLRLSKIMADPPVANEFKVSNIRGTLAMAKKDGKPNSAKNQWFFNLADNNAADFDAQNGGFTVFGRTVGQSSLNVLDKIGAVPIYDAGAPLNNLPLIDYQPNDNVVDDTVVVRSVAVIPMLPKAKGDPALLKVKVSANTNPGLVETSVQGRKLLLRYTPGQTGAATITVTAKDTSKNEASLSFNVTVQ